MAEPTDTKVVETGDETVLRLLSGPGHENLRVVADMLDIQVGARGAQLHLSGEPAAVALASAHGAACRRGRGPRGDLPRRRGGDA